MRRGRWLIIVLWVLYKDRFFPFTCDSPIILVLVVNLIAYVYLSIYIYTSININLFCCFSSLPFSCITFFCVLWLSIFSFIFRFVYIYSALRWITNDGVDILTAQYIFIGFYIAIIGVVAAIYLQMSSFSPWLIVLLSLSKRFHSIFILRLFNDGLAMLLLYVSVYLFMKHKWYHGCVWFSLAVSIKMNVLLFAPGLLFLLLLNFGVTKTILPLAICGFLQILLGAPFLLTHPVSYLTKVRSNPYIFEHFFCKYN